MRWLIAAGLLFVVLGLHGLAFLTGASGLARILADLRAPDWAPWLGAAFLEVAKASLLAATFLLLATPTFRHRTVGVVAATIWVASIALSFVATKATVGEIFDAKARAGTMSAERRAFLRAELADAEGQLKWTNAQRPAPAVAADIERLKLSPRFASSEACTNATAPESRTLCDQFQRLQGERVQAEAAAQVRGRIADLRRQLGETPVTATTDPLIVAFDQLVGRHIGVRGTDGIALLVVLMAELGSIFGASMITLVLAGPELQKQRKEIDALADAQVAELTKIAGEMRQTLQAPTMEGQQATLQLVSVEGQDRCPGGVDGKPSKPASDKALEGIARPSNENDPATLQVTDKAAATEPSNLALRSPGRTLQVVGSHTAQFVAETFDPDAEASLQASEIWSAYERWTRLRGLDPISQTKLGRELVGLGLEKHKHGVVRYSGLRLKPIAEVA